MAKLFCTFFSGMFAGLAMTTEHTDIMWQATTIGVILYLMAWALDRK